jgi:hypothetical protein
MFGVMNKQTEQQVARARRVGFFIAEHTITPAIPRVTALAGQVTTLIGESRNRRKQPGARLWRLPRRERHPGRDGSGAAETPAEIGRTARALPRDQYPGVREQFRVPNSLRYQQTIDTGHAFLAAIGPIKAAFVERAYPADFDEQLSEQIAAFESGDAAQGTRRAEAPGGTSGLGVTLKKAKEAIDELDAILSVYYRDSNPALYAVWKTAVRCTCRRRSRRPRPRPRPRAAVQGAVHHHWPVRRASRRTGLVAKPTPRSSRG